MHAQPPLPHNFAQQVRDSELLGPLIQIGAIEPLPLNLNHAQNIVPLAIRDSPAFTEPDQLGQNDVFGAGDGKLDVLQTGDAAGGEPFCGRKRDTVF